MHKQSRLELEVAAREFLEPLDQWTFQCHAASIALVRSGVLGPSRVARGTCIGVGGQHSWVVVGDDCYAEDAVIVDPTLWSYDEKVKGVWVGNARDGKHDPFGSGSIFAWGRPENCDLGEEFMPARMGEDGRPLPWSKEASIFLDLLGPLDKRGWVQLAHAPVEGWPAREIIEALCDSGFDAYVPIDIKGMVTDRNPGGLYLPTKEKVT